jgi:hypothetical protein
MTDRNLAKRLLQAHAEYVANVTFKPFDIVHIVRNVEVVEQLGLPQNAYQGAYGNEIYQRDCKPATACLFTVVKGKKKKLMSTEGAD